VKVFICTRIKSYLQNKGIYVQGRETVTKVAYCNIDPVHMCCHKYAYF